MRIDYAVIAAAAAVLTGVGGAAAVVQVSNDSDPSTQLPASSKAPSSGPTTGATATTPPTSATPPAVATVPPVASEPTTAAAEPATTEGLSEENLIRERLYYDVTRHSFTRKKASFLPLGPCTGDLQMGDVTGDDVTRLDTVLAGSGGREVVEQLAETNTPNLAAQAADTIVTLVEECEAIEGGDFGYGDPVLVSSEPHHMVWYFPAFDSDSAAGGYAVFNVGTRVGVLEVNDTVGQKKVALLAKEAARLAGE
jgi:hypothetical protein